jgi:hypothetical protein
VHCHCKYPRCEQHDKINFDENVLSRGPPSELLADHRLENTGLDDRLTDGAKVVSPTATRIR